MIGPKLLIDTNILIGLEDNKRIASNFSTLHQKCQQHGVQIYVHEASKQDIERDKNLERQQIILSKVAKFLLLEGIPLPEKNELESTYGRIKKPNDYVDVTLLYTLHEVDAVDFLITQDRGLHKRAQKVGAADRVFRIEDALVWLRDTYDRIKVSLPYIEEKQCHQINRKDEIFVSLREDYTDFDKWFHDSCVKNHRDCWTINFNEEIAGIAIRKDEAYEDLQKDVPSSETHFEHPPKKALKICTFKIKKRYGGEKLGEQLIKQVLWWAHKNTYDFVYLTVYPKHKHLIDMLMQYGFESIGRTKGELYLGKTFKPGILKTIKNSKPLYFHRQYYPEFLRNKEVGKYLIPIKSEYYNSLFPENASARQQNLFDAGLDMQANKAPGNTIRKVYVCHAGIQSIEEGDILLFFHLKDENSFHSQTLITIGITDGFDITRSHEELLKLTAKRSVFNPEQLVELTSNDTKKVKVINFLLAGHINPAILYDRMQEIGIKGPYQSIRRISNEHFQALEKDIELDVKTA